MRTIRLGVSDLQVPVIGVGCMRISSLSKREAEAFIQAALEEGANFFDHADIYGGGRCEEIFAEAIHMNDDIRDKIIIQSKCGIRKGMYDFSRKHILQAVDGSLRRLKTDYLDVLLLHRPDALVEPEEVAEAFEELYTNGKVRYFGVSNHNPMQIQLLQKSIEQPIVANQLQFSIAHATMVSAGINVNMMNDAAVDRDGSVLDPCRPCRLPSALVPIPIWVLKSIPCKRAVSGTEPEDQEIADKYQVSDTTIALAWIAAFSRDAAHHRHQNIGRLKDCCKAAEIHRPGKNGMKSTGLPEIPCRSPKFYQYFHRCKRHLVPESPLSKAHLHTIRSWAFAHFVPNPLQKYQ